MAYRTFNSIQERMMFENDMYDYQDEYQNIIQQIQDAQNNNVPLDSDEMNELWDQRSILMDIVLHHFSELHPELKKYYKNKWIFW